MGPTIVVRGLPLAGRSAKVAVRLAGWAMSEGRKGVLAIAAAAAIWGLSGLYFKALAMVPPLEMLSHRTLWSVAFLGVVLLFQRRGGELVALLGQPRTIGVLAVSATLIAVNWLLVHPLGAGRPGARGEPRLLRLPALRRGPRLPGARRAVHGRAAAGDRAGGARGRGARGRARGGAVDRADARRDLLALRGDQGAGAAGAGADRAGRDADPRAAGRGLARGDALSTAGTTSAGGPAGSSGASSAPASCSPAPG